MLEKDLTIKNTTIYLSDSSQVQVLPLSSTLTYRGADWGTWHRRLPCKGKQQPRLLQQQFRLDPFLCGDDLKLLAVLAQKSRTIVGFCSSLICEQPTPLKQYVMRTDPLILTKLLSHLYCLSRRGCAVLNCTKAVESWFYT